MNTADFIIQATAKHGTRYDYSQTIYKTSHGKVVIGCNEHGIFEQAARNHLRGSGCIKCNNLDTKRFIERSNEVHNNRYSYLQTVFVNSHKKVIIECPEHGSFHQTPTIHLRGSGCIKCGFNVISEQKSKSQEEWLKTVRRIHKDRYDYSETKYIGALSDVTIRCREHGLFTQKAHSHTQGNGCPYCSGVIRSTERFIERAGIRQPKGCFTYEHTHYVNSTTPVIVTCVDHGPFTTNPSDHIRGGNGCVRCQGSSPEQKWLDSLNINERQVRIRIGKSLVVVDGFDPQTNTVYEFHGDFWHGNPEIYKADQINQLRKISFGAIYQKTLIRENLIKAAGYNLVVMWEKEWKTNNPLSR